MKITTFNPLILTKDSAATIKLFEELGFEKRHNNKASTEDVDIDNVRMKDANGFYVDIAQVSGIERDMTMIRINVDDFDEAYKFLIDRGFTNPKGGEIVETKTNKSTCMIAPSGFSFDLCQHIKD